MPIPTFQEVMLPLLRALSMQELLHYKIVAEHVGETLKLSPEDMSATYEKSGELIFLDRVVWAATHMRIAGLLERPQRGFMRLTERGKTVLSTNPSTIDVKLLQQYPEYVEHFAKLANKEKNSTAIKPVENISSQTPEDMIETGFLLAESKLIEDLKQQLADVNPFHFEKIVVRLLRSIGYGGSESEMAKALATSGDGGVDGWIKEDKLGLDVIYIQAKRHKNPIGKPDIQAFVGALEERKSNKGIFVTTSYFTSGVKEYLNKVGHQIVPIDGERLTELMLQFNVGVRIERVLELKSLDLGIFSEDADI